MDRYPNPHKAVPYDPAVFARKETSRHVRQTGLCTGARGYCSNHPDIPAVVMQERARKRWYAYCAHCVDIGKQVDQRIKEQLKNEAARTNQSAQEERRNSDRRDAPNAHILFRDPVGGLSY